MHLKFELLIAPLASAGIRWKSENAHFLETPPSSVVLSFSPAVSERVLAGVNPLAT